MIESPCARAQGPDRSGFHGVAVRWSPGYVGERLVVVSSPPAALEVGTPEHYQKSSQGIRVLAVSERGAFALVMLRNRCVIVEAIS